MDFLLENSVYILVQSIEVKYRHALSQLSAPVCSQIVSLKKPMNQHQFNFVRWPLDVEETETEWKSFDFWIIRPKKLGGASFL